MSMSAFLLRNTKMMWMFICYIILLLGALVIYSGWHLVFFGSFCMFLTTYLLNISERIYKEQKTMDEMKQLIKDGHEDWIQMEDM